MRGTPTKKRMSVSRVSPLEEDGDGEFGDSIPVRSQELIMLRFRAS